MPEALEFDLTLYPEPILRKRADPVTEFGADLRRTVAAMFERMAASKGVGLAAPQVGLKLRLLVANPTGEPADAVVLVNPAIVSKAGPDTTYDEGCLSFPGIYAEIRRPERCTIQAFDLDGKPFEKEYDGFLARILQHEFDHLEGVLLVDRMSPADKHKNRAALEELVDRYKRKAAAKTSR